MHSRCLVIGLIEYLGIESRRSIERVGNKMESYEGVTKPYYIDISPEPLSGHKGKCHLAQ